MEFFGDLITNAATSFPRIKNMVDNNLDEDSWCIHKEYKVYGNIEIWQPTHYYRVCAIVSFPTTKWRYLDQIINYSREYTKISNCQLKNKIPTQKELDHFLKHFAEVDTKKIVEVRYLHRNEIWSYATTDSHKLKKFLAYECYPFIYEYMEKELENYDQLLDYKRKRIDILKKYLKEKLNALMAKKMERFSQFLSIKGKIEGIDSIKGININEPISSNDDKEIDINETEPGKPGQYFEDFLKEQEILKKYTFSEECLLKEAESIRYRKDKLKNYLERKSFLWLPTEQQEDLKSYYKLLEKTLKNVNKRIEKTRNGYS